MEFLSDVWCAIKAALWEGNATSFIVFSDNTRYSDALEIAAVLRAAADLPVSVKIADNVSIGDKAVSIDESTMVIMTEMSSSIFNGGYFTLGVFKSEVM